MGWITFLIVDSFNYLLPLLFLFGLFLIGYTMAIRDFKPKTIFANEDPLLSPEFKTKAIKSTFKNKELTYRELGIADLNLDSNRSMVVQKHSRMQEAIRDYSSVSPDLTANIIKNWLNER